ncbi:lysophospholipase [Limibacter armeniacum]|uniref:alpha/beta hydrolase n=1 Tax=Limibacter armeniacum TaxID=466084 RepID=UPI002FE66B14
MDFNFSWETKDKVVLEGKGWMPDNQQPKAIICMVHGFGEHIGRYEHVAKFFNTHGYGFIGYDLRGHGKSGGKRGVVPSYDSLMENITEFLALVHSKFEGIPIILYGHSMGGNLVTVYTLRERPSIVKAVIVTSPWLRLTNTPAKPVVMVGKVIGNLLPSFTLPTKLVPEDLSSDLTVGRKYQDDPLVHGKISSMLFSGVNDAGQWALLNANLLKHPLLLMHGNADNITSHKASEEFIRNAPSDLVTYKSWNGMRHELHNEMVKDKVLEEELQFIQLHLN